MLSPRWIKVLRDLAAERGRLLLMLTAMAVSLIAVGAVLGAYALLIREVALNYRGTQPAAATLELSGDVDRALVEAVRARPEIAEAEARDAVLARVRVGEDWRPLLLFVIDDFERMQLNTFTPEQGAWPPPDGTMLVERSAVGMIEAGPGQSLRVKTPHGLAQEVRVSGAVHDPGLAPAWQERMGYGYVTRATLARLGEPAELHELRIGLRDAAADRQRIEAVSRTLAQWLAAQGREVLAIRVPPPGKHPHQLQMVTVLFMLSIFAAMTLVLSAILVATNLAALLARQVREIGVMKTVGARSSQIAAIYLALVAGLALASLLVAVPGGALGALAFSAAVAKMLNLELTSTAIPGWVFAVQAAAGVLVPLLLASIPIRRASSATIRATLDQHGASSDTLRVAFARLPRPLRNALRRPARLALTLILLAAGGAMFMTALNLKESWLRNLDKFYAARHYDLELRFQQPESLSVARTLRGLPGVRSVEAWGWAPTSVSRPGEVEVSSAYPDGRHLTFDMLAPPPGTTLVRLPVLEGRWLNESDTNAVVLNHGARAQLPGLRVGDTLALAVSGRVTRWRLVGVVEEVGAGAIAYVSDQAFAAATQTEGSARMLRLVSSATSAEERTTILRAVERSLTSANVPIEQALPLSEHRTAVGDHLVILLRALIAMASVMAIVGALGLASTMGVSVIERTRELAVMKTIGATPRRIVRELLAEALVISLLSWVLAFCVSLPLTLYVDGLIGNLGFLAALPFVVVPSAAVAWLALAAVVSVLATWLPARRASSITIREALAFT
jgi:putative ABC transport system permease protein